MEATDSEVKHVLTVYLNNVATKSPSETLLLWVVELIVGEVPWVFDFRLGHVLTTEKPRFSVQTTVKKIRNSPIGSIPPLKIY